MTKLEFDLWLFAVDLAWWESNGDLHGKFFREWAEALNDSRRK